MIFEVRKCISCLWESLEKEPAEAQIDEVP